MLFSYPWRPHSLPSLVGVLAAIAIIVLSAAGGKSWAQSQDYFPQSLFIMLYDYDKAFVQYDVNITGQDVTVPLFGNTINDLAVTDSQGNNVVFEAGTGEVTIHPTSVSNVSIRYSTADLVVGENTVLTLSVNSPAGLSVQLPKGSSVVDWGQVLPSSVNSENLLVFPSGDIRLRYVLGLLGTEERANAMIGLAQQAMSAAESRYPDIVLSRDMLQQAMAAENEGNYLAAESLSTQTIDRIDIVIRDYEAAKEAIRQADFSIGNAAGKGLDTSAAVSLLKQAEDEFQAGSYMKARESAIKAASTIGDAQQSNILIFAVVASAAAIIAAFFVLKRPQKPAQIPRRPSKETDSADLQQPAVSDIQTEQDDQIEETSEMPVETVVRQIGPVPDSVTDQQYLSQIVTRILEEKPQLRPEDQDVLKFLVHKEGAAFESEIRGRFQLPKTTVWRLVKRLEREELVEIRKAGGQNLIKLRFEDRQT